MLQIEVFSVFIMRSSEIYVHVPAQYCVRTVWRLCRKFRKKESRAAVWCRTANRASLFCTTLCNSHQLLEHKHPHTKTDLQNRQSLCDLRLISHRKKNRMCSIDKTSERSETIEWENVDISCFQSVWRFKQWNLWIIKF